MHNQDVLDFCSTLLDKITIIKGYLRLNMERRNVDHSFFILQGINDIETMVKKMSDTIKVDSGNN